MNVLVTGGAGYIGSHTVVELLNAGHNPIIVDDLSNAKADVIDRIETITGQRPTMYVLDCKDKVGLKKIFTENSVDAVIHFAAFKAVGESVKKPLMYYRNNLDSAMALLEVMEQDYVTTAYAKGLKGRVVIWKHALRNALIPVVTVVTMQIGRLIGGAVVTETVFALPGVGREIVDAILSRDYPVVMGMILVVAALVVVTNALVDVLYILIDPRISTSSKS